MKTSNRCGRQLKREQFYILTYVSRKTYDHVKSSGRSRALTVPPCRVCFLSPRPSGVHGAGRARACVRSRPPAQQDVHAHAHAHAIAAAVRSRLVRLQSVCAARVVRHCTAAARPSARAPFHFSRTVHTSSRGIGFTTISSRSLVLHTAPRSVHVIGTALPHRRPKSFRFSDLNA